MNNKKIWKFIAFFTGAWGFGIAFNLFRQIPFNPLDKAYLPIILLMLLLITFAIYALNRLTAHIKQSQTIEKDEMSIKISYTALAAATQILPMLLLVAILLDDVVPFLNILKGQDILIIVILLIALIQGSARYYYNKHPEKT